MRPLILVGLLVTAVAAASGFALLFLLAVIVLSSSGGSSSYSGQLGSYPAAFPEYPEPSGEYYIPNPSMLQESYAPIGRSPADPYINGDEIDSGIYGGGTVDPRGRDHVYRVGTEVLDLPN